MNYVNIVEPLLYILNLFIVRYYITFGLVSYLQYTFFVFFSVCLFVLINIKTVEPIKPQIIETVHMTPGKVYD